MPKVVLSSTGVVNFPEGGGHLWVYLQYVHALQSLGCEVYWMEGMYSTGHRPTDEILAAAFQQKLERWHMAGRVILYFKNGVNPNEYVTMSQKSAERIFADADLLLNFDYRIDESILAHFQRTVMIDIDPGLLQFWMGLGQIRPPRHDFYFTTGETVGKSPLIPSQGIDWNYMRPPVCLDLWTYTDDPGRDAYTTVSGWWGGHGKGEWVTDGESEFYENNKRVSFLQFVDLPRLTNETIELALTMGDGDPAERETMAPPDWQSNKPCPRDITDYEGDEKDRWLLESFGWKVRSSTEVAGTPERYQRYIRESRGEFSCAKPSCMRLANAWVSDRSLCYLASGKPIVVQYTGASSFLPHGLGMFRFSSLEEAADAFAAIRADYRRHSRAARDIAETWFDARLCATGLLEKSLGVRAAY